MDPALISTVNAFAYALVVTGAVAVVVKVCLGIFSKTPTEQSSRPLTASVLQPPKKERASSGSITTLLPLEKSTAKGAET